MRYKIGLWLTLPWGLSLGAFQVYKYVTDTLNENTNIEIGVFFAAVLLVISPILIVRYIKKKSDV